MAVAHDGEANLTGRQSSADPWTLSGKTTAGANRFGVFRFMVTTGGLAADPTWGGVTMTLIGSKVFGGKTIYAYGLIAPPTASSSIVLDLTGPLEGPYAVTSYNGVHQTTPTTGFASNNGTSTTPTVDVTSATGQLVLDAMDATNIISSVGGGQTSEYLDTTGGSDRFGASREAGAGTVTMSWTIGSASWATLAFALQEPAGGGGSSILRQMMQHHRGRRTSMVGWRRHESGLYLRAA